MQRRGFIKTALTGAGAMALAGKAWALKYHPVLSDKKWAVLYGTWCGTSRAAAFLGMDSKAGAIRPGGFVDLVAVEGNPLVDIKVVIHKVIWVMKDGMVVVDRR